MVLRLLSLATGFEHSLLRAVAKLRNQFVAGPFAYSSSRVPVVTARSLCGLGVQSRERQRTANKLALGISVANVWIVGVAAERSVNRSASGTDRHTTDHRKSLQFDVLQQGAPITVSLFLKSRLVSRTCACVSFLLNPHTSQFTPLGFTRAQFTPCRSKAVFT